MNKGIVVAGATGEVGRRLVEKLIVHNLNADIHVLVRAKSNLFDERVQQHIVDFSQLDSYKLDISFDIAYCCLGTTIKRAGSQSAFKCVDHNFILQFAHWAQHHGAKKFACISAIGANAKSSNFYLAVKGETEHALTQMDWHHLWLIRPSLLLGQRDEFRLGEYLGSIVSLFIAPLMFGPLQKYKPIHMLQVAQKMAELVSNKDEKEGCYILEGKALFNP
ncbi:MAG: hypothetical protein ACI8SR_000993 [Oceanicoccus sp.]|jgi:uncharacterized protein YbjT (DUF2867 family)